MTTNICPPGQAYSSASSSGEDMSGSTTDDAICTKCELGFYKEGSNMNKCLECQSGMYSNDKGSQACNDCQKGRYQPLFAQSVCLLCPMGKFLDVTGSLTLDTCSDCSGGMYSNATGLAACFSCSKGKHNLQTASVQKTDCRDCRVTTYNPFEGHGGLCLPCPTASKPGSIECEGCDPGTYRNVSGDCIICAMGKYSDQRNSDKCTSW